MPATKAQRFLVASGIEVRKVCTISAIPFAPSGHVVGIIARFVRTITLRDRRASVSTSTQRLCDSVSRCPANDELFCGWSGCQSGLDEFLASGNRLRVERRLTRCSPASSGVSIFAFEKDGLTAIGSNPYAGGQQGFQAGASQGLGETAVRILDRFLNRLPTITIRAGHRLRIWFTGDVLVPPVPPPTGGIQ